MNETAAIIPSTEIIPIVYISGRLRHWKPNGGLEWNQMEREKEDERGWAYILTTHGCVCIAPIHNTLMIQGAIPDKEFIRRDVALLNALPPDRTYIFMRPHWDEVLEGAPRPDWYPPGYVPASEGASAELEAAKDRGIKPVWGIHGPERVAEYIRGLLVP